jgi:16S rRNA processing protein RimM
VTEEFAVAAVAKAHGIKGEIILSLLTDFPERFLKMRTVLLGKNQHATKKLAVEHVDVQPRGVKMKLKDVDDRDAAESLVGSYIFVKKSDRVRLPSGTFYTDDLIGCTVQDEEKKTVGVLKEIMKLPAQDVYVVESDGKEMMIPAVKEFIRSIDIDQRLLTVRIIDGLVE